MRKEITIVGVGETKTGKSEKTGREYCFTPISFTYEDVYTNGVAAQTVNVDSSALGDYVPGIGDVVEAVMHTKNFRIYIDAIL